LYYFYQYYIKYDNDKSNEYYPIKKDHRMSFMPSMSIRQPTEWDLFRKEQFEILRLRKKITGKPIPGKGNVMRYIGEQWRKMNNERKIKKYLATNDDCRCDYTYRPKYSVIIYA